MVKVERFLRELGQRIADLRKDAGLTQAQLADKVGVSQQIIASYESGKRNFPVARLLALADALNTPPAQLLTGTASNRPSTRTELDRQLAKVRSLPARKRKFVSEFLDSVLTSAPKK